MKFLSYFIIGLAIISVLPTSCQYDNEEELYPDIECDTVNVSYAEDIEPIIENDCATSGCHVAGGTGNGIFNNYTRVKAKVDNGSMRQRVVGQQDMPPDPESLTQCQIDKVEAWLDAGAPNN
jgi:hypothetical protein